MHEAQPTLHKKEIKKMGRRSGFLALRCKTLVVHQSLVYSSFERVRSFDGDGNAWPKLLSLIYYLTENPIYILHSSPKSLNLMNQIYHTTFNNSKKH